jgi:hypothetical protein
MEIHPLPCEAQLLSVVKTMDSLIDTLDLGCCECTSLYHAIKRKIEEKKEL